MDSSDVKAFFERVSVEWDDMRSSFYNADIIEALAERTGIDSTMTVVDVGTGTGFVAAGLTGRAAGVVGIDNSPAMLAVARDNLDALGAANVSLLDGEVDALPLPDDSVDVAVANMVLHHAPEPGAMLAEMTRVVRPGGRIAITDEIEHTYEWMRTEQADLWLGFSREQIDGYFHQARLTNYGYASLGMQQCVASKTSVGVTATIGIFAAWATVDDRQPADTWTGAETFAPLAEAPPVVLVAWPEPDALWGITADGSLFLSSDGGTSWAAQGSVGGTPEAFTASDADSVFVAVKDGIQRSDDAGKISS